MKVRNLKRRPPVSFMRDVDNLIKIIDRSSVRMSQALSEVYSKLREKNERST